MQYIKNEKTKTITGLYEVIKERNNVNMVIDFTVERLRTRLSKLMKKEMKNLRPDGNMLSWKTKLGNFCIYRDFEYSKDHEYDSPFRNLFLYVELDPRKQGKEVWTKKYFIRKEPNPEFEDYEECSCGEHLKAMYRIKIRDNYEMRCIKCKKFNRLMNQISKKLDKEQQLKNNKKIEVIA